MKTEFQNKMKQLTEEEIIELIDKTWDKPEGEVVREFGLEIIEDRCGEDYSDSVYVILWNKHRKK